MVINIKSALCNKHYRCTFTILKYSYNTTNRYAYNRVMIKLNTSNIFVIIFNRTFKYNHSRL